MKTKKHIFQDLSTLTWDEKLVKKVINYDFSLMIRLIDKWYDIFYAHKEEKVEETLWDDSKVTKTVGVDLHYTQSKIHECKFGTKKYKSYYFYDEFIKELENICDEDFALLLYMQEIAYDYLDLEDNEFKLYIYYIKNNLLPNIQEIPIFKEYKKDKYLEYKLINFREVIELLKLYAKEELDKDFSNTESYNKILLNYTAYTIEFFKNNLDNLPVCFDDIKDERLIPFLHTNNVLNRMIYFDDNYVFDILKNILKLYEPYSKVGTFVYFYFLDKGLLSRKYLVNKLLDIEFVTKYSSLADEHVIKKISYILKDTSNYYKQHKYLTLMKDVYNEVIKKMVEVELKRTQKKTIYTNILSKITLFYGVDIFAKILDKMKNIDFFRKEYNFRGEYTYELDIQYIFSHILFYTVPEENLTNEKFEKVIKNYKISDKKLLEGSIYNEDFIEFSGNYLSINNLKQAMYYFKVYCLKDLEYIDKALDKTKKMLNRYSIFKLEDCYLGKMDIKWFKQIQEEMSKENYKKVYEASSKSYTKGGMQDFADAVLGNLDIQELEEKISNVNNYEDAITVPCFSLIPFDKDKDKEALRRYEYILKKSKQFNFSPYIVEIALSNLAMNYGLEINLFIWLMEAKLINENRKNFELQDISKDQISLSLENAMINSNNFTLEELELINTHPKVKEFIKNILFICDDFIGFFKGKELINFSDETYKLIQKSKIRIAHCVDLFENSLNKWQSYITKNKIQQAFNQVFRELYALTEEELINDGYINRFAGYEIINYTALEELESKNWLLNDKDGFEKVNHTHNLRINLYYQDKNEDTKELTKITFVDNKTEKTIDMKKLDKILFSETMRELDLIIHKCLI